MKNKGYNVFVSGCVYECNEYKRLNYFFDKHTIKQIKPGKTNQAELLRYGLEQAEKQHPNCLEYISLRADYLMLREVNLNFNKQCVGLPWNKCSGEAPDVFFIIPKDVLSNFINTLNIYNGRSSVILHSLIGNLKKKWNGVLSNMDRLSKSGPARTEL